jgi:hypothetical protein
MKIDERLLLPIAYFITRNPKSKKSFARTLRTVDAIPDGLLALKIGALFVLQGKQGSSDVQALG